MRRRWLLLAAAGLLPLLAQRVAATSTLDPIEPEEADLLDDIIDAQLMENRICFAMNAKNSVPGGQDAYVELTYASTSRGAASLAIYNLLDQPMLGGKLPPPDDFGYICTGPGFQAGMCDQVGKILFRNDEESIKRRHAPIKSTVINFQKVQLPHVERYDVTTTGLYCIIGMPMAMDDILPSAQATIKYVNAHGLLPAADYPKLMFYGVTCLLYLGVFLLWMAKSAMHWSEILPVQKYISGVVAFLVFETAVNYFFWESWNKTGDQSWALLFFSAILNSARNSLSLFILLIVSMGYGVVKPSLGDDMRRCQILAGVHLVFGALYAAFTLHQTEHKGLGILLVIIPLSVTLTLFYVWTLSALTATTQHLEARRQHYKLHMYKNVWRLLFFAGLNLVAFFIVNTIWFARRDDVLFLARWWRWRWFVVDGWLNVLYTVCMLVICALWRPTSNNARYGLEELVSDPLEDEFELDAPDLFDAERFGGHGIVQNRGTPGGRSFDEGDRSVVFALEDSDDEDKMSGSGVGTTVIASPKPNIAISPAAIRSRSPSPTRKDQNGSSDLLD